MLASTEQVVALAEIFKKGTRLTYGKYEYVIRPGEDDPGIFYIEAGLVKSFTVTKYGEENLLIIRRPAEIFPLVWAVMDFGRDIIYQTLESTVLWRLDKETCFQHFKTQPELLPPVLDMVTDMYRVHAERIMNLGYRSVRERLVSFLLTMYGRFGKETAKGLLINAPLRHKDIASAISASRETTSRELEHLEDKGLIKQEHSYITLKDMAAIKAILA